MEGGEVNAVGHIIVVGMAKRGMGGACDTNIEEGRHEAGDVLRHGTADSENQRVVIVAQTQTRHDFEIMDSLFETLLEMFGMTRHFGGEDDEIGDGVTVLGEFHQHAAFVADVEIGKCSGGDGGDEFIIFGQGVCLDIVDYLLTEMLAVGGQFG